MYFSPETALGCFWKTSADVPLKDATIELFSGTTKVCDVPSVEQMLSLNPFMIAK